MISPRFINPTNEPEFHRSIGDFVSAAIFGHVGRIDDYVALAIVDGAKVIAGVLYNNWHPDNGVVEMHAASIDKRWLTRRVLKAMFSFPFGQMKCQMCILRVSENNKPMLRIAKAYGFNEHVIPRLRGRDEAEHILTLTDDDWRLSRFHKDAA